MAGFSWRYITTVAVAMGLFCSQVACSFTSLDYLQNGGHRDAAGFEAHADLTATAFDRAPESGPKSDAGRPPSDGDAGPSPSDGGIVSQDTGGTDTSSVVKADGPPEVGPGKDVREDGAPDAPSGDTKRADVSSDGPGPDMALVSFNTPLQVDVTALFTVNTVASTAPGGAAMLPDGALTGMDDSANDFYTAALAKKNGVSGGLPSDGYFSASGTRHPNIQLHFSDASVAPNSLILVGTQPGATKSLTFALPSFAYEQVQIYGTSTEGDSALTITLTYADQSTTTSTITMPDWGAMVIVSPVFVLASGIGRLRNGAFENRTVFSLYGANLGPDTAKPLVKVTVANAGSGRFVFYGATAW